MTNHTELLNAIARRIRAKTYLEIGVQNPGNNLDKIKCERRIGVDPDPAIKSESILQITSDFFFSEWANRMGLFDLIFIDGLHHADQVGRDFKNSLKHLRASGVIVIHDTLPSNEEGTKVPRETRQWWGDVYKWAMTLDSYSGIDFLTADMDNGCTVVWRTGEPSYTPTINDNNRLATWAEYERFGKKALRVCAPDFFKNKLNGPTFQHVREYQPEGGL